MSVPHLVGGRHQGYSGPNPWKPFAQHLGQHFYFRMRGSRDLPHHQRPGPGDHPQRQHGPAEEAGRHGAPQPGRAAADQGRSAHAGRVTGESWCRCGRFLLLGAERRGEQSLVFVFDLLCWWQKPSAFFQVLRKLHTGEEKMGVGALLRCSKMKVSIIWMNHERRMLLDVLYNLQSHFKVTSFVRFFAVLLLFSQTS